MCPVAPALTFYCHHVVICPFPSLTNEPEQPGQDLSADVEEDHCCGPINNAKKAPFLFVQGDRRRHLLFFAQPPNRLLELCVLCWRGSLAADALRSHCREWMRTDASSRHL